MTADNENKLRARLAGCRAGNELLKDRIMKLVARIAELEAQRPAWPVVKSEDVERGADDACIEVARC